MEQDQIEMNDRMGVFPGVSAALRPGASAAHSRRLLGLGLSIAFFLLGSPLALAAMAPKFERVEQLAAALDHLSEIAHLLDEPIDHIDITQDEVRFFAGRCYVPAIVRNAADDHGLGGRISYIAEVGKLHCS
jgi:hypothetical protein